MQVCWTFMHSQSIGHRIPHDRMIPKMEERKLQLAAGGECQKHQTESAL